MQKGFATLEIIFAVLIISILVAITIPNVVHVIDRVSLDYETKKIYTDLKFLQSHDRMAYMADSHFNTAKDSRITLVVYPERYILKKVSSNKEFYEHYFSNGVTASKNKDNEFWQIKFDNMGKVSPAESDHLTLTSGRDKAFYIYFDTVGRFQPSRVEKY